MKLVNRTDAYRILALTELGRVYPEGLPAATVADRRGIPGPYLAQLVGELVRAGLVRARRGPGGGLSLARTPESISMAEIFDAVEGDDLPPLACRIEAVVNRAVTEALAAMSIADLVRWDRPPAPEYSI